MDIQILLCDRRQVKNLTMRCNLSHDFIIENNYIICTIESHLYSLILNIQDNHLYMISET